MDSNKQILIFNFAMDDNHPVLAHQSDVVRILSRHFSKVVVVTARVGNVELPANVSVFGTSWENGKFFNNVWNFYRVLIHLKDLRRFEVIFFHMVVYQVILAIPFLLLSNSKKFLWYAHRQNSLALKFACSQMDFILSSSKGSFPFETSKLKLVGQMVDSENFKLINPPKLSNLRRFVHIGRLDASKQVDKILGVLVNIKSQYPTIEFTSYGDPSNEKELSWSQSFLKKFVGAQEYEWVHILPSVPKREIAKVLSQHDVFIHSFQGSLDKTLIEATMSGIPVVTINYEYLSEFGSWTGDSDPTLYSEIHALLSSNAQVIQERLIRNASIARHSHSLQSWEKNILPLFGINE